MSTTSLSISIFVYWSFLIYFKKIKNGLITGQCLSSNFKFNDAVIRNMILQRKTAITKKSSILTDGDEQNSESIESNNEENIADNDEINIEDGAENV